MSIDTQFRQAAFHRLSKITTEFDGNVPWEAVAQPVLLGSTTFFLASRAIGIFKPKQFPEGILSIKTVVPKQGRINIYSDGASDEGGFWYSLEAGGLTKSANRNLMVSYERKDPIIYLIGIAPGRYFPLWPCYIDRVDIQKGVCHVGIKNQIALPSQIAEIPSLYQIDDEIEKRYTIRDVKSRVHQAEFRARVMLAYSNRCAMTGLPIPQLLEAAHIIPDAHATSAAAVSNGISLSRLHHRAFDANLVGIDPDYRIHINKKLLATRDGPLLESMKQLNSQRISVPHDMKNRPSRDALALRYEQFLKAK